MAFRVGQKIVCVDDTYNEHQAHYVSAWIKCGDIYTVRAILPPDFCSPLPGVALEEIIGQPHPIWDEECGWRSARFRPVVERKTDISTFTAMLNPSLEDVEYERDLNIIRQCLERHS